MREHDEQEQVGTGAGLARRALVKALVAAPVVSLGVARDLGAAIAADGDKGGPSAQDLGLPAYNSVISILDNGPANPYGSAFEVKGLKGFITDVNLILKGFRHDRPSDVGIMLDHGGRAAVVLRNVGGATPVRGANILLNDDASDPLPIANPIEGGRAYKPLDNGTGDFGGGAPGASSGSPDLETFNGLTPNGEWVLWVRDSKATISGSLTGWQLEIVTDQPSGNIIVIDNYRTRRDRTLRVSKANGLLVRDKATNSSFRVRVATPPKGKLRLRPDGSFVYKPTGKRRKDSFTYTIEDEFGSSIEGNGKVNIRIDPERDTKKDKNRKRDRR